MQRIILQCLTESDFVILYKLKSHSQLRGVHSAVKKTVISLCSVRKKIICFVETQKGRELPTAAKCTAATSPVASSSWTDFKYRLGDIELYKSRMTGQPDYLSAELRSCINRSSVYLRSSSQELLTVPITVPHCKTMLGRRRFSVAAFHVWKSSPLGLKTNCDSLRGFKTGLKTYIYFARTV